MLVELEKPFVWPDVPESFEGYVLCFVFRFVGLVLENRGGEKGDWTLCERRMLTMRYADGIKIPLMQRRRIRRNGTRVCVLMRRRSLRKSADR